MVAGDLFADIIMSGFTAWPERGEEAVARDVRREVGGGAAITACGLAKLGSRVGVLGVVGTDVGDWMIERLQSAGVDTSGITYDLHSPTAFTVAVSDAHDRSFFTYLGANRMFPQTLIYAANERLLAHARHVHLACAPHLDTAAELLNELRQNGCCISLDVGWHEQWLSDERSMDILRYIDIFFPNEREAQRMTGVEDPAAMLRQFAQAGAARVALKLGREGAALLWNGETLFAKRFPVNPIDTTGAGDCFNAGFLYAWLGGRAPAECLRAAAICGALSTEALGGVEGFPTAARLECELKGEACTS